jgi:hypothetical protein
MLNLLTAQPTTGGMLTLTFADASDGLLVESIEGLDPVKATLVSSGYARLDGEVFHTARRVPRNMKIRINLEPDYVTKSVADLRRQLYAFFMPKTQIRFGFHQSDGPAVNIDGVVESCETALFAKEPAVDISIMCFDPDFIDYTNDQFVSATTDTSAEALLEYPGTVETGIYFQLLVNRALEEFTIYHRPPDGSTRIFTFAASLVAGDVLRVDTRVGTKGVRLTRGGSETSLLYAMSPYSNWIELSPGDNFIRVFAEGAAIPYTIDYLARYGGL